MRAMVQQEWQQFVLYAGCHAACGMDRVTFADRPEVSRIRSSAAARRITVSTICKKNEYETVANIGTHVLPIQSQSS